MRGKLVGGRIDPVVGERVALSAAVTPLATNEVVTWEWLVTGFRVKDYDLRLGNVTELTDADLDRSFVDFYWYRDAEALPVVATATYDLGRPEQKLTFSGTTWFKVRRPWAKLTSVTNAHNPPVWVSPYGPGTPEPSVGDYMHFGDVNPHPGITWYGSVSTIGGILAGALPEGEVAFVQLIDLNSSRTREDGTELIEGTNGSFWLDKVAPYGPATLIPANGVAKLTSDDSPGSSVSGFTRVFRSDRFKLYLMYKPKDGIWVSLRSLRWRWSGIARKNDAAWVMITQSSSKNPGSVNEYAFPEWDRVFTGG